MRVAPLLLLPVLAVLSACAPIHGRPNGWGAPLPPERAEVPRPDARPRPEPAPAAVAVRRAEPAPAATASGLLIPVAGVVPGALRDSFHAPRSGGRTHHAIDIAAPSGTPVVAVTDGAVTRKHWNALGGNTLYLRSADGRFDYYYAHLEGYAEDLEIGTEVRRGDVLGFVGMTGNARSPHLHFQVLDLTSTGRGAPVNPYDLLRAAGVALVP
jgi:murein DD-endopeptidase MepM/ murein hydrolase activator NlpD